jgi:hypothetical protein
MIDPAIRQKVTHAAREAARRARSVDSEAIMAAWLERLKAAASHPDLPRRLQLARTQRWAGAVPTAEPVDLAQATAAKPVDMTGIDGSQVYPHPNSPVLWSYIQAIAYRKLATPLFDSLFIDIGSEIASGGRIADELLENRDDLIALTNAWRTVLEMRLARSAACTCQASCTVHSCPQGRSVFFDNGLLPWLSVSGEAAESLLHESLADLCAIRPAPIAGVISGPQSRLLSRLVHLIEGETVEQGLKEREGPSDAAIMRYLLDNSERSALFLHGSPRNEVFTQVGAGIFFFFLRIQRDEIARVEIPEWVARDPQAVDAVQASVLADAAPTGYSYVLSQAHRQIVIPMDITHLLHTQAETCYLQETGCLPTVRAKTRMKKA